MKILHVEAGKHLYGGARQVLYIVEGLAARGVDNLLACPAGSEMSRQQPVGARVLPMKMGGDGDIGLVLRLARLIRAEQPDLVVVGAGINIDIGAQGQGEQWDETRALLEINVMAAFATVEAALPAMRARGHGQIALFSSLAGWRGLPVTPSYSASKAAIRVYGEAIRDWLAPEGVKINVIVPGYVESKMCFEMPGPKPFLWSAEKAANRIKRGLAANQARISFPFPLNLGTWLLGVIPQRLSSFILRGLNYSE